jgi:NDP-sugar pyrophosphorylase family protein/mannose-6-phosphate isomerase-like protein (cupin superfamily)
MKTIIKPWGKEEWLELNDKYCYKRIYINAGYKTSYQYHEFKQETNYIISGEAEIWLENESGIVEKTIMKAGDYFSVTPYKKHRVIAITDIILQEVSTPEVDDVIRIEDDTHRIDGKIAGEHTIPAVLILAAGKGTRLNSLTNATNKALLPINNRAIISHIIDKFPNNYEFVIPIGHFGQYVKEYCTMSFPNHKFTFVEVDIEEAESGPGYSALKCEKYLQRPFYISTCDCIIDDTLPQLDGNWLGIQTTSYPEKYSTIKTDEHSNILEFSDKSPNGFKNAFIGLASIWDFDVFWKELKSNMVGGEIVSAFKIPSNWPTFKTKKLKWLDTGNLDDLTHTRTYFNDVPLSLSKTTNEITYKENDIFIKFSPNKYVVKNRVKRANILIDTIPSNFNNTENFISYDWKNGDTLYNLDSYNLYTKFLETLKTNMTNKIVGNAENVKQFYVDKTMHRITMFVSVNNDSYINNSHNINGIDYPPLKTILEKIDYNQFNSNPLYSLFHGDLQFDNVIYTKSEQKFTYIDWRESFGTNTECGDIYYDLAKLYGGCLIPYNKMKNESNIDLKQGIHTISYSYNISENLTKFKNYYENWIIENGYDLDKVKLITALIFLNMSPLHDEKFSKMLWFKATTMLYECTNK